MAALIDADYLRDTFNIHSDVLDNRLTPYCAAASRRLQSWVGADNYADAELLEELKLAEGMIAMNLLQLNLNTSIRGDGLVRRETVEGNVQIEYLSAKETADTARAYLEQAEAIVQEFSQLTDIPPAPEKNDDIDDLVWPSV